jgi:hypothetical protein
MTNPRQGVLTMGKTTIRQDETYNGGFSITTIKGVKQTNKPAKKGNYKKILD